MILTWDPDSRASADPEIVAEAVPGAVSAISKIALDFTVTAENPLPPSASVPASTTVAPV